MPKLDHIMYGVRDLDAGIVEIEDRTGVRATFGGFHPGNGTCNALVALGVRQYLEIIAPDPEQGLGGTLGEQLITQRGPRIRTWAVATEDLDVVAARLAALHMASRIADMSRTRPDGVELSWRVLFVSQHGFGNLMPFFIDWRESRHPAEDAPAGCRLTGFRVSLEDDTDFAALMAELGVEDVEVTRGGRAMTALLDTPAGRVALEGR